MINKFNINILFTIALTISLLAIGSCKKEEPEPCPCTDPSNPECVNFDPCYGAELPSAKFKMTDGFLHNGEYISWEDDIFRGFQIDLSSDLSAKKFQHTWYIGSEVFYTQNPPSRRYESVSRPATITVSHVIRYEPDTLCFSDDDGYDSVAQSFYLIKRWDELGTYGSFRGVIDNETDSFELGLYMCDMTSGELVNEFVDDWTKQFMMTVNFHNLGDTVSEATPFLNQFDEYGSSFRVNANGVFAGNTEGEIEVLNDGTLYMHYRVRDNQYNKMPDTLWHTFRGIKLP